MQQHGRAVVQQYNSALVQSQQAAVAATPVAQGETAANDADLANKEETTAAPQQGAAVGGG